MLMLLSVVAVVLGVIAAVNFGGGVFTIDLSNIAYIKFLQGNCGFVSMIFGLVLSVLVFLVIILICHWKSYLMPLGIMFYLYLVYSQAVIFMSIILIYGILNCIILAVLLLVYSLLIWCMFLFIICEACCYTNTNEYFKCCFSWQGSKVLWCFAFMLGLTILFSVVLTVLKSYVIILIF